MLFHAVMLDVTWMLTLGAKIVTFDQCLYCPEENNEGFNFYFYTTENGFYLEAHFLL